MVTFEWAKAGFQDPEISPSQMFVKSKQNILCLEKEHQHFLLNLSHNSGVS